jgi:hypothetical protein
MKIIFNLNDFGEKCVGIITIEGNWQNKDFRNHVYRFLQRMEPPNNTSEQKVNDNE